MKKRTAFLDLDGVIVAWTDAVLAMYGVTMPPHPTRVPYETEKLVGTTAGELWDRINAGGVDWWANLSPYPWCHALHDAIAAEGLDVVFLTATCRSGNSATGKARWLRRHFGDDVPGRYVITARKELLAHPGAVLIDDRASNVEGFRAAGGSAVLFPRQWNDAAHIHDDGLVDHVIQELRRSFLPASAPG